jgi:pyruvate dehydrogenase E1 component alpha subunit
MLLSTIKENNLVSDDEINAINHRVEEAVNESVRFAEESPWPDDDEVLKDIYMDKDYPYITD